MQVLHVCFHPSEYLLATGSEDRLVRFWDIDTEECVSQSDPADGTLREVTFHNDGSALLTLTDRFALRDFFFSYFLVFLGKKS